MTSPYPAKLHIRSLATHLLSSTTSLSNSTKPKQTKHILYLQGQHTLTRDDTDRELPFHQEANFHYLTGCLIAGSALVVVIEESSSGKVEKDGDGSGKDEVRIQAKLFVPPFDSDAAMWSVPPPAIEDIAVDSGNPIVSDGNQGDTLDFDLVELGYVGQPLKGYLTSLLGTKEARTAKTKTDGETETVVHLLSTNPLDPSYPIIPTPILALLHPSPSSPSTTPSSPSFILSDHSLLPSLHASRLIKSPLEISYIREANRITSIGHEVLMRELGRFASFRAGEESKVCAEKREGMTSVNIHDKGEEKNEKENEKKGKQKNAQGLREWEIKSEQDAEAVFVAACKRLGADQAYLPIVASGSRASTLHYVCNDRIFPLTSTSSAPSSNGFTQPPPTPAPGRGRGCCGSLPPTSPSDPESDLHLSNTAFTPQVLLIDAGCEVRGGYASDVTRTIPIGNGGRFTREGRWVYELVLRMQKVSEGMLRPGVHWDDLHFECHRILCEAFLEVGIFKGATVEEVLKKGLTAAFYPHGLGHSLGLDVHDSLQLLRSEHIDVPQRSLDHSTLFRYLRIRRPILEGMVLTIEPGCYFSPNLMESFGIRQSEFVDTAVLDQYVGVGGVRIEDCVVVTKEGCENLTTIGREVDWIEGVCSGTL